jgi:transposase-like protein
VARERGVNASQLFGWRRQMLAKGLITDNRSEASADPALTFAPVEVKEETAVAFAEQKVSSTRRHVASGMPAMIEIELRGGDRVRVEGFADFGLVVRIISALRRA